MVHRDFDQHEHPEEFFGIPVPPEEWLEDWEDPPDLSGWRDLASGIKNALGSIISIVRRQKEDW